MDGTRAATPWDFDEAIDRFDTGSMKWTRVAATLTSEQRAADPLPMWVADMDFRVASPIVEALRRSVDLGVFGYGDTPASCLEAAADWQDRRFGWKAQPGWIVQTPGVVSALSTAIQAFTDPGDGILVQPPVYLHIHHEVALNGREPIFAPLVLEGERYRFDAAVFEAAIRPGTTMFILCNPHNPTGNVFSRDDLTAMATICERHGILVVADEVHQDLVLDDGLRHVPFAALDDAVSRNCVVCTAPSKTFNTAGLQCANVFIPDATLRTRFRATLDRNGLLVMNTMGTVACDAAYRHGEAWADAMLAYVRENQRRFAERLNGLDLPMRVLPMDSLYLAWIDCRATGLASPDLHDAFLRRARLWLDPGAKFGPGGDGFMRINLGCRRALVDDAVDRIKAAFKA